MSFNNQMNHKLTSTSTANFNPCIVHYSDNFNVFIIGSYELIEDESKYKNEYTDDDLHRLNNRIGSLNVYNDSNVLIHEHRCRSGGVFDFKISDFNSNNINNNTKCKKEDFILASHSNGILGFYKFDGLKINLIQEIDTGCQMLTTVDDFINNSTKNWIICVGSSDGQLLWVCLPYTTTDETTIVEDILVDMNKQLSVIKDVVQNTFSLWYLKMTSIQIESKINNLIFVCSEDSLWKIFKFKDESLLQIYQNSDCSYGVTSVEFLVTKVLGHDATMIVLIGSYDEYLRIYNLFFQYNEFEGLHIVQTEILKKIHIPGGGIWRIRSFDRSILLLSAMYSGAYWLRLNVKEKSGETTATTATTAIDEGKEAVPTTTQEEETQDNSCPTYCHTYLGQQHEIIKFPLPEDKNVEHLIYGIASNQTLTKIMISSFYTKQNFFFTNTDSINTPNTNTNTNTTIATTPNSV